VGTLRRLVPILAGVALVAALAYGGLFDRMRAENLRSEIEAWGALGPLAFMGLMICGFFVPAPLIVLVGIGGAVFGAASAFVYGWIAAIVGTTLSFLLARGVFYRYTRGIAESDRFRRLRAIDGRLAEHGFVTVLGLRLLFFLAPPLSWLLGVTRVRLRDYLLGTAIGITPGLGVTVYLGDAVSEAESARALLTPQIVVPGLLVGAFLIASGVFGRRFLARRAAHR